MTKPYQTRIFVPPPAPYGNNFVENVVALVINPVVTKYKIEHFWFSRYGEDAHGSSFDTDFSKIPPHFQHQGMWRSVRFRLWAKESDFDAIQTEILALVTQSSCWASDLRSYPDLDDLANPRFCGGNLTQERRVKRRDLMRDFLTSSASLYLDMLEGPNQNGEYRLEENFDTKQNPEKNTFQSIHHLFCNMTEVPLRVLLPVPAIGTDIYPPQNSVGFYPVKVRF